MVRYSVLCLLLDSIEAESRVIAKSAASSRHTDSSRVFFESATDPFDIDNFCRRLIGASYSVICRHGIIISCRFLFMFNGDLNLCNAAVKQFL